MEESERGLSVTALTLLFLLGVGVCAVFFSLGFLVGYKERSSKDAAEVERVTPPGGTPPVVNPPPEKEEISSQQPTTPPPIASTVQQPVAESAAKSQARPEGVAGNVASAANASGRDAGSGTVPATAQGAAAAPRNPGSSEVPSPVPTKPATGGIVLQVAALQSVEDAKRLVKVLKEQGYPVFLVTPEAAQAGDKLFRVRVGPYSLRDEAEKSRQKLVSEGFKPFFKR